MPKDEFCGDVVSGVEQEGGRINKEVMDTLFSKEDDKVLMITEFSSDDLVWVTALQAELRFLVEDFITTKALRLKCQKFCSDVYKMRISKNRAGRTELFDALKAQTFIEGMSKEGMMQRLKGRLR